MSMHHFLSYLKALINEAPDERLATSIQKQTWKINALRDLAENIEQEAQIDIFVDSLEENKNKPEKIRTAFKVLQGKLKEYESIDYSKSLTNPALISAIASLLSTVFAILLGDKGIIPILSHGNGPTFEYLPLKISGYSFLLLSAYVANFILVTMVLLLFKTRYGVGTLNSDIEPKGAIAKEVFNQFKKGWFFIWLSWLLLYSWWILDSFNQIFQIYPITEKNQELRALIDSVADFFNIISSCAFLWCFLVLDKPSVATKADPERAREFARSFSITIGTAVLCLVLSICDRFNVLGITSVGKLAGSGFAGLAMIFLFGRLDSFIIGMPRVMLLLIYVYAMIQIPYAFFDKLGEIMQALIIILAFTLKFALWTSINYIFVNRRLADYLDNAVELVEKYGRKPL